MDGCSKVGIFFRIIILLIKPAVLTAPIFVFYSSWDDFLGSLFDLNDPKLHTVSLALHSFASSSVTTGGVFAMVGMVVSVFILLILFQKYLEQGINTTGLKG